MTNYIENFVGDENPVDIEVAIAVCFIRDQLKQGMSPHLPRIHTTNSCEEYVCQSGALDIEGVIDIES